jgi:hypothetical protein
MHKYQDPSIALKPNCFISSMFCRMMRTGSRLRRRTRSCSLAGTMSTMISHGTRRQRSGVSWSVCQHRTWRWCRYGWSCGMLGAGAVDVFIVKVHRSHKM